MTGYLILPMASCHMQESGQMHSLFTEREEKEEGISALPGTSANEEESGMRLDLISFFSLFATTTIAGSRICLLVVIKGLYFSEKRKLPSFKKVRVGEEQANETDSFLQCQLLYTFSVIGIFPIGA